MRDANEFVLVILEDVRFHDDPSFLPVLDDVVSHLDEESLFADLVSALQKRRHIIIIISARENEEKRKKKRMQTGAEDVGRRD